MMVEKNTEAYDEMRDTLTSLLREGLVTVTFQKESTGSYRDMICTLASRFLPASSELKATKTRKPNPDVCVVYDMEREDWRSFRFDTVIQFKTIDGVYIPKDVRVSTVEFIPSED